MTALSPPDAACTTLVVTAPSNHMQYPMKPSRKFSGAVKYMECLKNHAAAIGGSATDGCGEFMAGGADGSLEALMCSACNCHRNFHRKIHILQAQPTPPAFSNAGPPGALMKRTTVAGGEQRAGGVRKRYRTKFSQEQKEKMVRFAEKGGWKLQKMDDSEVASFCQEIGIKRKVLKVWMHNNKYHLPIPPNKTTTTLTSP